MATSLTSDPRVDTPLNTGRRLRTAAVACLPGAAFVALWLVLTSQDGGYFARDWYPAAIVSVALLAVVAAGTRRILPAGRPARVALGAFGALVALSYLSIAWAGSRADAFEASNQLLFLLVTGWAMAIQPAGAVGLLALLGTWSTGVAVICAVEVASAAGADDLTTFLDPTTLRLNDPMGYPNATTALAAMALLPALALASWQGAPAFLRGALLGVAVFLGEFALLPQSRGIVVGLALALPVLLAFAADRGRLLLRILVAAGLVALAAPAMLAVGNATMAKRPPGSAVDGAVAAMLLTFAGAVVIGTLLAVLEDRIAPRRPGLRLPAVSGRQALATVALAVLIGGGVAGAALGGRVADWTRSTWTSTAPESGSGSRLLSLAPEERPDYARVAWDLFRSHPVAGVATGNFGREYDARRRLPKHSRYPHNLVLRFLAENGLIGLALFLATLAAFVAGGVAAARRLGRPGRTAAAGSLAAGAYLVGHGMLDWLEKFPALSAAAVGFAFAVGGQAGRRSAADVEMWWQRLQQRGAGPLGRLGRPGAVAAGAAAFAAGAALLVPPWLSVRYLDRAAEGGTAEQLSDDLRRAGSLNPFAVEPAMGEGRLAIALGRPQEARDAFARVLDREEFWPAYVQLALLDAQARRWTDASRRLEQASRLDARDEILDALRRAIRRREQVDPAAFDRMFVDKAPRSAAAVG